MQSCRIGNKFIKWEILHLDKLHILLNKSKEVSGIINIDFKTKKTTKNITYINGNKSSVKTPDSILNYHSHPAPCYIDENTVWGFPSGEDTRECVIGSLNGSVAHVVVAIEGMYVCQVNPYILNS